jgi:hypothetical protein
LLQGWFCRSDRRPLLACRCARRLPEHGCLKLRHYSAAALRPPTRSEPAMSGTEFKLRHYSGRLHRALPGAPLPFRLLRLVRRRRLRFASCQAVRRNRRLLERKTAMGLNQFDGTA